MRPPSQPSIRRSLRLQGSGADVLSIAATPKFAAQAIRKTFDLGWTPVRYMTDVSQSIASVLKPAGLEKSKGVITAIYGKDPTDARWKDDPGFKEYAAFIGKYMAPHDLIDANAVYGFGAAPTMIQVLKQCGNDLSRDNVMKQAANLKDLELPMLLPGIKINTSPDNFSPIRQDAARHFQRRELGAVRGVVPAEPRAGRALPLAARPGALHPIASTASNTGSAETIGWRRRSADAARKRSNGSRCGHSIVPAMRQSAASREAAMPRWLARSAGN